MRLTGKEKQWVVFGLFLLVGLSHGIRLMSFSLGSGGGSYSDVSSAGEGLSQAPGRVIAPFNVIRLTLGSAISSTGRVCPVAYRQRCFTFLYGVRRVFGLHE